MRGSVYAGCGPIATGVDATRVLAARNGLWPSIGSTNFDNRSLSLNDEASLNVLDADFAAEQERVFEEDKPHARRATLEAWEGRPRSEKFQKWLSGLLRSQL